MMSALLGFSVPPSVFFVMDEKKMKIKKMKNEKTKINSKKTSFGQ
jgi:hypothetical protein